MKKITISSVSEIPQAAEQFVHETNGIAVFALYGGMGVGKTSFIKEVYRNFGVVDEVTSPTFAIINEYKTSSNELLYHFDLYRLDSINDARNIGVEEYLDSGCVCMIEWPEIIESLLPEHTCRVYIQELADGTREISF